MSQLLADEDFPNGVVLALRQSGADVITVVETGQHGKSDEDVLAFATSMKRAVLTHNRRHFIKLHKDGVPH